MKSSVLINKQVIGELYEDNGTLSFFYAEEWLSDPDRFPLSPALPLDGTYEDTTVKNFFENLLPEGRGLDEFASSNKTSKTNVFALLRQIGKEMTGALFLIDKRMVELDVKEDLTEITLDDLSKKIQARPYESFFEWKGKFRLSIAGYQDKVALQIQDNKLYLVNGMQASTHILKPEPMNRRLEGLTSNEYFCMQLASNMKLFPVAKSELMYCPEPVYCVERFDRIQNADKDIGRIYTLDACQAMGLAVQYKMERNFGDGADVANIREGVSLPKLFTLTEFSPSPATEKQNILRWAIYQVLIGNMDAHGKNISFFFNEQGLRMAPAYDMVCTLLYDLEDTLAMAIGDAFDHNITAYDWALMASQCSLNPRLVKKEIITVSKSILQHLKATKEAVSQKVVPEVIEDISRILYTRCEHAIEQTGELINAFDALAEDEHGYSSDSSTRSL